MTPDIELANRLVGQLIDLATQRGREELKTALRKFFDKDPSELDGEMIGESGFWEYYVHDYRTLRNNRTAVQELLRRRGATMGDREREQLEAWRNAYFGLFQIESVTEGVGVELSDIGGGEPFFLHDVNSSRTMIPMDAVLVRVEEFDGKRLFTGNGLKVPRWLLPTMLRFIDTGRKETGQTASEFVRTNSHRLHRVLRRGHEDWLKNLRIQNAEGDPLEFSVATYDVKYAEAVLKALAATPGIEETSAPNDFAGTRHFAWLQTVQDGARRSYGHIEIRGLRLRLECNSRARLAAGRRLIEEYVVEGLSHSGDAYQSLDEIKRSVASRKPPSFNI